MSKAPAVQADDPTVRRAVQRCLSDEFGRARQVVRLVRRPCDRYSSFALEELEVELEDGTRLEVMFKDCGLEGLTEAARAVKPSFLHDPQREIETYRRLLAPASLGTAFFYGAAVEPEAGRYWLFIEKATGWKLDQTDDFRLWLDAASWLARMHERLTDPAIAFVEQRRLLAYDGGAYRRWMARALEFAPTGTGASARDCRRGLEWLRDHHGRVVERLEALPPSFVHGDFHPANVVVRDDPALPRICPVDWELAGLGPAGLDLAALVSGKWNDEERRSLCSAYHGALQAPTEGAGTVDELIETVAWCRIQLAIQWLGWAPVWTPPFGQRQDWLTEALGLGEWLLP